MNTRIEVIKDAIFLWDFTVKMTHTAHVLHYQSLARVRWLEYLIILQPLCKLNAIMNFRLDKLCVLAISSKKYWVIVQYVASSYYNSNLIRLMEMHIIGFL